MLCPAYSLAESGPSLVSAIRRLGPLEVEGQVLTLRTAYPPPAA